MKCPICGNANAVLSIEDYHYEECGVSNIILVGLEVMRCAACGNIMPNIPNIDGLHQAITQALLLRAGLLSREQGAYLQKYDHPLGITRSIYPTVGSKEGDLESFCVKSSKILFSYFEKKWLEAS